MNDESEPKLLIIADVQKIIDAITKPMPMNLRIFPVTIFSFKNQKSVSVDMFTQSLSDS